METITRETKAGTITGQVDNQLEVYYGIPYAEPPIDTYRFKHAALKTHWDNNNLDATSFGPIPLQPYNKLETFFSTHDQDFEQSEDCLYLNVWKPQHTDSDKPLPVIIWFYGGGFLNGHGSAELYQPQHLAKTAHAIVITFNYRLGALGFTNWHLLNEDYDMNCGLSDQLAVLKWVQYFIPDFDGDKDNVTLMGQSAGAMSIQALMHLNEAEHLFHKVILSSGTLNFDSIENSRVNAYLFKMMTMLQYNQSFETLTTPQMMKIMDKDLEERKPSKGLQLFYRPIFTPDTMSESILGDKPVLAGYTASEGDIYIRGRFHKLKPKRFIEVAEFNDINIDTQLFNIKKHDGQAAAITEYYFKQPLLDWLNHYSGSNKWLYRFDWSNPASKDFKSPYHILDVIFWLGHLDILSAHGAPADGETFELENEMQETVGKFIRSGECSWKPYTPYDASPYIFK
ncbi:putative para-nitrobenzyl esterase chain A [Staphylococcus piscifermentans]|uniref:Carboxylic ester hydrolase n=1 Tax=Staphylococcus piscifermentans TaxID=70258 RepID=A0A239TQH6_9STAP|nr:carboxylesterase family protein [Staphylococcus piscifermentans]RTX84117.1 carboxylesterase/lipase family protein [Staphylococcus piscifermentans]GEP84457.1 carboxylic ester hydrolase [Staphylococcus piscifermentans]SNU99084.1 putative para-nitrobenzyl esterase chain A [Staphylococcus piscifermentans]